MGRSIADALLSVLFAPPCVVCGAVLEAPTAGPVCARCWSAIVFLTPPLCSRCSVPLPSWRTLSGAATLCPRCRRHPGTLDRAAAVGPYDGALRTIIHALKYDARRSLARPVARLMMRAGAEILADIDVVVPVPLHASRRRARGFNQAADLAAHLGPPVVPALRRVRRTPPQTGLPAARRHRNVRDAFALRPMREAELHNKTVLLVDDVATTGATLEACARALKAAEVREVRALTAARAVTRPL